MTKLPNWVDLIVVIVVLRACYGGFGRGFLAELLNVAGAVGATVVAINFWKPLAEAATPWLWVGPEISAFLIFLGLLLCLIVLVHMGLKRIANLIRWERVHWSIQGMGLVLGGLRGLWWSGLIVLIFVSSGVTHLRQSVEERSVLGPRLLQISSKSVRRIADRVPGAAHRGNRLIPPLRAEGR